MKRACVIGWPVGHSRSPLIHNYWLRQHGIEGNYEKRPVRPDDVVHFVSTLHMQGLIGCNVTLPYKETAYAVAAEKRPAARAVGAANTLWLNEGKLVADNTDGAGFMAHLRASAPRYDPKTHAVSVLGAGGGARAIINALLDAGVPEVRVFNRSRARTDSLAAHFGDRLKAFDWSERTDRSWGVGALINATSLGMQGAPPLEMDLTVLDQDCIVADIVYVPLVTPLLAAARERGLTTVDGLGMLMHQAVLGFEHWFGVRPQVTDELRALLVADIEAG
jgi:shikimate dehydrogenase